MAKPRRPQHNTTSLPRHLRSELGIRDTYGEKKRKRTGPEARKDRRREERAEKKSQKFARPTGKTSRRYEEDEDDEDDFDLDDYEEEAPQSTPTGLGGKPIAVKPSKPKSALKKPQAKIESDSESEGSDGFDDNINLDESEEDTHEETPHISGKVKSKLDQDDAEIAALEKKLGLKKGSKLPKAFAEDGLDELMGDLGNISDDEDKKRKREADEWLLNKRRKAQKVQAQTQVDDKDDDSEMDSDEDEADLDEQIFGEEDEDDEMGDGNDFEGFDEEDTPPKKRENPYVAPAPKIENTPSQKYIPPSLRNRSDPESEDLTRLKRQAQGHLNKLSEANLISILGEFEKLYRDYPRQHVTSTIINLLMGLICERAVLQDTFLVLHAGFIAALYKIMGMDFGAEIVQTIVETLDAGGDERGTFAGKEVINLVSLLAQLYNFHVIGSPLMFDYIRLFLQEITETNTELLLKVIRSKPPQPIIVQALSNNSNRFGPSTSTG